MLGYSYVGINSILQALIMFFTWSYVAWQHNQMVILIAIHARAFTHELFRASFYRTRMRARARACADVCMYVRWLQNLLATEATRLQYSNRSRCRRVYSSHSAYIFFTLSSESPIGWNVVDAISHHSGEWVWQSHSLFTYYSS